MYLQGSPPDHTPFYLGKHAQKSSGVPKHQCLFESRKPMALLWALGISALQGSVLWCRIDGLANGRAGRGGAGADLVTLQLAGRSQQGLGLSSRHRRQGQRPCSCPPSAVPAEARLDMRRNFFTERLDVSVPDLLDQVVFGHRWTRRSRGCFPTSPML